MKNKGFTIIELIVSVTIFAFMTAFLMAKYGTFNQSILLTNLAYDVALTLRNAQSYGLNVKSRPTGGIAYTEGTTYDELKVGYQYGYGVYFEADANGSSAASKRMIFFADTTPNQKYDTGEEIATYVLRNGSFVADICARNNENQPECAPEIVDNGIKKISITFKRPNPDAIFSHNPATYVQLILSTSNGDTKRVIIRKTGQIAVLQN